MRKRILIVLLALLLLASIAVAATMNVWVEKVEVSAFLFNGQNARLTKALIGLAVFVVLGLFGVIYKGPKR